MTNMTKHPAEGTYFNADETIMVRVHRIIGTRMIVACAYERSTYFGPHSSITSTDDRRVWGTIASRPPTADVLVLPGGEERSRQVHDHYEAVALFACTTARTLLRAHGIDADAWSVDSTGELMLVEQEVR